MFLLLLLQGFICTCTVNCKKMQVTSQRKRAVAFYTSEYDSIHIDGTNVVLSEFSCRIQFPAVLCAIHYSTLSI
jgi:hypothetical protein